MTTCKWTNCDRPVAPDSVDYCRAHMAELRMEDRREWYEQQAARDEEEEDKRWHQR